MSNGLLLRITYFSVLFLILSLIATPLSISNAIFMTASAQQLTNTENTENSQSQNTESLTQPGEMDLGALGDLSTALSDPASALKIKMAQLGTSNKSEDIATLAYIWGYPLISMERSFNWFTNPNSPPGPGHGPANQLNCNRELLTSNDTDVVTPNADTLYCTAWLDLSKGPVVLKVPPIPDRYYTFQFLDAYTNVYDYVGTRTTGSTGGTYLVAGPDWKGTVPDGMTEIWSPTNLVWILQRTLLKGQEDLGNVHAIQEQMSVMPLSAFQKTSTTAASPLAAANASKQPESPMSSEHQFVPAEHVQTPISPKPPFIPTMGIKIYDEIGTAMSGNPLNPPDPALVTKFASIGIGLGKSPSTQANDTIKSALQTGITEGEKLIAAQVPNLGTNVNGWKFVSAGLYGTDYLFRAGVTKLGLGANLGQEAIYPPAFTDSEGKPLNGANNYTLHFEQGQQPPVHGFWSVSMYNNASYFVDNQINRYVVSPYTGLKNNTDGSLDIYLQNTNPGPEKESNWLPSPQDSFRIFLRLYLPDETILNGTWTPPPVKMASSG